MAVNLLTSLGDADGSDQLEVEGHWDLIKYQEFVLLNREGQLNKQTGLWGASPTSYVSCKNSVTGALARLTQAEDLPPPLPHYVWERPSFLTYKQAKHTCSHTPQL